MAKKLLNTRRSIHLFIIVLFISTILSCSRTKDTWINRTYHQTTAKFNTLFNGEQALLKAKLTIKQQSKQSFDTLIDLYPVTPEALVPMIEADLKRANEKATKAIKEHTMLIVGKQRNKTVKNAYFLIGEAYYYGRDYFKAIEIFNFISKEFSQHPIAVDAQIFIIKAQTQLGNYFAARETGFKYYKSNKLTKKQQRELLKAMAINEIADKNYSAARGYITEALATHPKKDEKTRLLFFLGQLYELEGNYFEANKIFRKVAKSNAPYLYQINAYLRMAANYDPNLMQSAEILKYLENLAKKDKNRDFLDAIYYQKAEVHIKDDHLDKAFVALQKSISLSTDNVVQKGLSYIKRGDLHFELREYIPAEANYDSALMVLPKSHFRYQPIEKKKSSLTELVQQLSIIAHEDSILKLASLDKKDLDKIIDHIIDRIKKQDEEAAREDEESSRLLTQNPRQGTTPTQNPAGGTMGLGAPGAAPAFYFYNQNTVSKGFAEFTNRWGNRKLEDHWRRRNKEIQSFSSTESPAENPDHQDNPSDKGKKTDPRYTREYYYSRIPTHPDSIEASHAKIRNAYEAAARIYKEVLEDQRESMRMLETLLKRYPNCDCTPRVYYALCIIAKNQGLSLKKETYCDGLAKKFPDSPFTALLSGQTTDSLQKKKPNEEEFLKYKQAYSLYKSEKYPNAWNMTQEALKKYTQSEITPKWWLLDALITAKLSHKDSLKLKLERIIATYPQSPEATEAQNILSHLSGEKSSAQSQAREGGEFTDVKSAPHQFMLVVENKGIDLNLIRSTISNFNSLKYANSRLQLRNILMGKDYQLILVSGFKNQSEALQYLREINQDMDFIAYIPKPNHQVVITSDNFRKFYQKQMLHQYVEFYNKYINLASN